MNVNAEELLHLTEDMVWEHYDSATASYTVHFPRDDTNPEPVVLSGTKLILTWYGLRLVRGIAELEGLYPQVKDIATPPVRATYCYTSDYFNPSLQINWMNDIFWRVWEDIDGALYPEELAWLIDQIDNDLYNMHVSRISKYISTMNIIDDIEIINDPRARKVLAEALPTPEGIAEIYRVHTEILDDKDGILTHNNLSNNWRAGLPKRQQTLQKVAVRGFLTEGDSSVIATPIMGSFTRGLGDLRDVAVESCSSKKAQIMTTDPVADTEYFSRRLQLLTVYVHSIMRSSGRTLVLDACSNFRTLTYTVGSHDVKNLAGSFRVLKDGTEVMLQGTESDLAGVTIDIRNPVYCGLRHEGKVCGRCMGGIAWSMDPEANLGHQSIIEIIHPVVQSVISTKHEDKSATGEAIIISDKHRDLIKLTADKSGIRFTDKIKSGYDLEIPHRSIPVPSDLYIEGVASKLNALNFSEVKSVTLINRANGARTRIPVSIRKTPAFFTTSFLEFMASQPFNINAANNIIVNLSGLELTSPVLQYPVKHRNTLDYMNDLAGMIESKGDTKDRGQSHYIRKMTDFDTPDEAMAELAKLIYSSFSVNIAHLGVLLLAILCKGKDNASIPHIDERSVFLSRDDIIDGRSVTTRLAFQGQGNLMKMPKAYTVKDRMPVPMDIILR